MRTYCRLLPLLLLATAHARAEEPKGKPAAPASGQAAFEAATRLEGEGRYAEAARALEQLGHRQPDDPFADDALFEAAVIAEEKLGQPAHARELYDEVATRYPQSRLERRARTRAEFLRSSLRTGEAPLREYDAILNGYSQRPVAESIRRMEALLGAHPDFALADRALYWLGSAYANEHRDLEARKTFLEAEQRFPRSEFAARAKKARGDLALATGHPYAARAIYTELAASSDPLARAAGREGLGSVSGSLWRTWALLAALAYLLGFFALHIVWLRRGRRPGVPAEVLFYAPVAAAFVLAGLTENSAIAIATSGIAAGGLLVVWVVGALAREPASTLRRLGRAATVALAVLSVSYVAVQSAGLTDLVIETIRSGPER